MKGGHTGSRGPGVAFVVLATACWSTSGVFINFIMDSAPVTAVGLAFWRDLLTSACLLAGIALVRPELLRVRWPDIPWLALMGASSIGLLHVVWNTAVTSIGVSVATVMQSNAPMLVSVVAWLLWREPLTGRKLFTIGLALVGTILIARLDRLDGGQMSLGGLLTGLLVAAAYGSMSLFGKKLTGTYSPWTVMGYAFGFGALALLPFQFALPVPWPLPANAMAYFAALVLFTSVLGFTLFTAGLHRLQASVASIVGTTEVAFSAITSYLLLGERLDAWQVLGAVLIVSGVILISLPGQAQASSPHALPGQGTGSSTTRGLDLRQD